MGVGVLGAIGQRASDCLRGACLGAWSDRPCSRCKRHHTRTRSFSSCDRLCRRRRSRIIDATSLRAI